MYVVRRVGGHDRRRARAQLTQDSKVLAEQFYFFTVVIMWLIHVGFMAYEAGVARRKNIMATAMKNILTIAVVTPAFYYFGWWIYACLERGFVPTDTSVGPISSAARTTSPAFCKSSLPWSDNMGPNLADNITGVFWAAFLLFSWTTASIMSGALIERVRLAAYLFLATVLGSVVWILDAAWGWSAGGWLVTEFGFHDAIASGVVHGVAGAFTLGVLFQLGPRIGKYTRDGVARSFLPHNLHLTLMGLMLIFTGLLRLLRGLPRDPVDGVPRLGEHLLLTDNALVDHVRDHDRLRGRLHRRVLHIQGRSVLDAVGGLAGVIGSPRARTSTHRRSSTCSRR